jgi:hypothetical protein
MLPIRSSCRFLLSACLLYGEHISGWFSEKSGKNLSQSYGHWIVGFDGPMTSAFFALKKG